jgi:hypothetical protein
MLDQAFEAQEEALDILVGTSNLAYFFVKRERDM